MKKYKILWLLIIVFLCSGCTQKYVLTYENENFSEKLIVSDIKGEDKKLLNKYREGSMGLVIDDENSYQYQENDKDVSYSYNIGKKFKATPLMELCFEDVLVVDEKEYIHIKTFGDYFCQAHDIKVYLKTDKYVLDGNYDSKENGQYKWDSIDKGLEIKVSKVQEKVETTKPNLKKSAKKVYVRLAICVIVGGIVALAIWYFKKKEN
jgi:hypothetical protein